MAYLLPGRIRTVVRMISPRRCGVASHRRDIARGEKTDALAVERMAHRLQMHQMRGAADFDVALCRRTGEGIEEPARILVGNETVPFAADDRHRRPHQRRIIS